ncbi:MAG: hypothetical protein ACTHXA_10125 [Gulosibacter sp.]|uniref:hypothetical protein n=1 Tax=Gulosibacter sp. TaxID=2817531 RepID=UPI003F8EEDA4
MASSRRSVGSRRNRGSRSRHGRALRSSVAGPHLPQLTGRIPRFHQVVGETVGFLRAVAPEAMKDVKVGIASMPASNEQGHNNSNRWHVASADRVVLFRVPIERLVNISLSEPRDQVRYREYVEHTVMLAVNDLLGGGLEDILHRH